MVRSWSPAQLRGLGSGSMVAGAASAVARILHHSQVRRPPLPHLRSTRPRIRRPCPSLRARGRVRPPHPCLVRTYQNDDAQHWIKDMKFTMRVKDEEGYPAIALVNKATGEALKHSLAQIHPCPCAALDQVYEVQHEGGGLRGVARHRARQQGHWRGAQALPQLEPPFRDVETVATSTQACGGDCYDINMGLW